MITQNDLDNWFTYHSPKSEDIEKYTEIRQMAYNLADTILRLTPPSADQTADIRKLRDAVMTANAAIACNVTYQEARIKDY
jgi:hypothetical protein